MWGIFFGEFQCLPVYDRPAASCDPGVLTRGSESTSFYSAILLQGLVHIFGGKNFSLTLCHVLIAEETVTLQFLS